MGWLNKFQQGGAVAQSDQNEMIQKLTALVQAAMQGDQKAAQTIQQIQAAAEQGDQQAAQVFQAIQQIAQSLQGAQPQMAKCGAKLKTNKIPKKENGGCGCKKQLHRQGGRIVEGDCL